MRTVVVSLPADPFTHEPLSPISAGTVDVIDGALVGAVSRRRYAICGGVARVRLEYLRELAIDPGDKVLEVSIGTGANPPYLPADAEYFGLDISWGMLKKCRRNLKRWNRSEKLFLGEAEMIRVAKPGTKIVIVDETEEYAAKSYDKTRFPHPF